MRLITLHPSDWLSDNQFHPQISGHPINSTLEFGARGSVFNAVEEISRCSVTEDFDRQWSGYEHRGLSG